MKTLQMLLDDAIKRMDLVTDADLARLVKVSRNAVSRWRKGHSVPENHHVKFLADLAAWNEDEALFFAAYWRADEETRQALQKAKNFLASMGLAFVLAMAGASPAQATLPFERSTTDLSEIYIITHLGIKRRAIPGILWCAFES